jgi:hypothetical protein
VSGPVGLLHLADDLLLPDYGGVDAADDLEEVLATIEKLKKEFADLSGPLVTRA